MNQLEYHARIRWTQREIVLDAMLSGHSAAHHERAWSSVQSWAAGQPALNAPAGIWLLLSEPPYFEVLPALASGAVALTGELRRRGCPELSPPDLMQEAERRALRSLAQMERLL